MRIGIYGGSFNPVHFGHIGLAEWVLNNTDLDEVWLLVSPNSPLKDPNILADENDRLRAVEQAIAGKPGLRASDFEFTLPRPNYTANTLRELQRRYPEHEFTLIIGEDNLAVFDHWREWQFILDNFHVFVYPRHHDNQMSNVKCPMSNAKNLRFLANAPYFDISSTEIRKKNLHMSK